MMTIWKYPLEVTGVQMIDMPFGATPLTVQVQGWDTPCLWALVDPKMEKKKATILTFGTGHAVDKLGANTKYLGTYQLHGGALVFHVWIEG